MQAEFPTQCKKLNALSRVIIRFAQSKTQAAEWKGQHHFIKRDNSLSSFHDNGSKSEADWLCSQSSVWLAAFSVVFHGRINIICYLIIHDSSAVFCCLTLTADDHTTNFDNDVWTFRIENMDFSSIKYKHQLFCLVILSRIKLFNVKTVA